MRNPEKDKWNVMATLVKSFPFPQKTIVIIKKYEDKYNMSEKGHYIVFGFKQYRNLK